MVHVVCALVVLLCWTSKPLDINTPELLSLESDDILGLISLAIQSQVCPYKKSVLADPHDSHSHAADNDATNVASNTAAIPQGSDQNDLEWQREALHSLNLRHHETLPFGLRYEEGPLLHLQPTDINRLRQATQYVRGHYGAGLQPHNQALPRSEFNSFFSAGGNYAFPITDRYGDPLSWLMALFVLIGPWFYGQEAGWDLVDLDYRNTVSTLTVTLIYSGLHLSAWSGTFPTQAEEICWKTASIIPVGNAVYAVFTIYIIYLDETRSISYLGGYIGKPMVWIFFIVGTLNGIARLYLTIESFASLRNLPIGAFSMPVWLQLFPHL